FLTLTLTLALALTLLGFRVLIQKSKSKSKSKSKNPAIPKVFLAACPLIADHEQYPHPDPPCEVAHVPPLFARCGLHPGPGFLVSRRRSTPGPRHSFHRYRGRRRNTHHHPARRIGADRLRQPRQRRRRTHSQGRQRRWAQGHRSPGHHPLALRPLRRDRPIESAHPHRELL